MLGFESDNFCPPCCMPEADIDIRGCGSEFLPIGPEGEFDVGGFMAAEPVFELTLIVPDIDEPVVATGSDEIAAPINVVQMHRMLAGGQNAPVC